MKQLDKQNANYWQMFCDWIDGGAEGYLCPGLEVGVCGCLFNIDFVTFLSVGWSESGSDLLNQTAAEQWEGGGGDRCSSMEGGQRPCRQESRCETMCGELPGSHHVEVKQFFIYFILVFLLYAENATHIPATETATAQKSRRRYDANVVGGFDFSQPLRSCRSEWQPRRRRRSSPSRSLSSLFTPFITIIPPLRVAEVSLRRRRERAIEEGGKREEEKKPDLSLNLNGRRGYHGPDAPESEKATASNQFCGRVRARSAQAAPDAGGGVQGARPDVRCQGGACSRSLPQTEWPLADVLSDHSDASTGNRQKPSTFPSSFTQRAFSFYCHFTRFLLFKRASFTMVIMHAWSLLLLCLHFLS